MKVLIYKDDGILGAWSRRTESSKGVTDAWIKLFLHDEAMLDAILARYNDEDFRGACKTGGSIIEITLNEYSDLEDTPPQHEEQKAPLKASQKSALICKDPLFGKYCKEFLKEYLNAMGKEKLFSKSETEEESLAKVIRYICSIKSRAELDTNETARNLFNTVIDKPFWEYKKQQANK